jgi:hypothetical protein
MAEWQKLKSFVALIEQLLYPLRPKFHEAWCRKCAVKREPQLLPYNSYIIAAVIRDLLHALQEEVARTGSPPPPAVAPAPANLIRSSLRQRHSSERYQALVDQTAQQSHTEGPSSQSEPRQAVRSPFDVELGRRLSHGPRASGLHSQQEPLNMRWGRWLTLPDDALLSLISGLVAVLLLIVIAKSASNTVDHVDKQIRCTAKYQMSVVHPDAMCIPSLNTRDFNAMSTRVQFAKYAPEMSNIPNTIPQQVTILALHCCSMIHFVYTSEEITSMMNCSNSILPEEYHAVKKETYSSKADADRQAACRLLNRVTQCTDRYKAFIDKGYSLDNSTCSSWESERLQVFSGPLTLTRRSEEIYGFKGSDVPENFFVDGQAAGLSPNVYDGSSDQYSTSTQSWRVPLDRDFNGSWRLDVGYSLAPVLGPSYLWLGIEQANETAECLASNADLRAYFSQDFASSDSKIWLEFQSLAHPFLCSDGVDVNASGIYSGFQAAAQFSIAGDKHFLQIKINTYSDLYAIYTAILGAIFGAFSLLVALLVAMGLQALLGVEFKGSL